MFASVEHLANSRSMRTRKPLFGAAFFLATGFTDKFQKYRAAKIRVNLVQDIIYSNAHLRVIRFMEVQEGNVPKQQGGEGRANNNQQGKEELRRSGKQIYAEEHGKRE